MLRQKLEQQYEAFVNALKEESTSHRAAQLLTPALIKYVKPRFHRCANPLKLRVIVAFLHLPNSLRLEAQNDLLDILSEAELSTESWIKKLSRLISSFVFTGAIDFRETDSETCFEIIKKIKSLMPDNANLLYEEDGSQRVNLLFEQFCGSDAPVELLRFDASHCVPSLFTPCVDCYEFVHDLVRPGVQLMETAAARHKSKEDPQVFPRPKLAKTSPP